MATIATDLEVRIADTERRLAKVSDARDTLYGEAVILEEELKRLKEQRPECRTVRYLNAVRYLNE